MLNEGEAETSSTRDNFPWQRLWNLDLPPKVSNLAWKECNNIIPVKEQLNRRGMEIDPTCHKCGETGGSIEHAIRDCEWVKALWYLSPLRLELQDMTQINIQNWICFLFKSIDKTGMELFFTLLWPIWQSGNNRLFWNKHTTHLETINKRSTSYKYTNRKRGRKHNNHPTNQLHGYTLHNEPAPCNNCRREHNRAGSNLSICQRSDCTFSYE